MSPFVKDLHWNPVDSNEIAIAYDDGRIAIQNMATQTQQTIFIPQTTFSGKFAKVSWHPQGQFLAAGIGNTVSIWQNSVLTDLVFRPFTDLDLVDYQQILAE